MTGGGVMKIAIIEKVGRAKWKVEIYDPDYNVTTAHAFVKSPEEAKQWGVGMVKAYEGEIYKTADLDNL